MFVPKGETRPKCKLPQKHDFAVTGYLVLEAPTMTDETKVVEVEKCLYCGRVQFVPLKQES